MHKLHPPPLIKFLAASMDIKYDCMKKSQVLVKTARVV